MAGSALGEPLPVRQGVALLARRHQLLPVLPYRIIFVESLVAVLTLEPMTAAIILELEVDVGVTLAALQGEEGLRF